MVNGKEENIHGGRVISKEGAMSIGGVKSADTEKENHVALKAMKEDGNGKITAHVCILLRVMQLRPKAAEILKDP